MNKLATALCAAVLTLTAVPAARATGLYTCDSGPREGWKSQDELKKMLVAQGWDVRRIKEDGGCWEVYAVDEQGKRVEAYFHPVTLQKVFVSSR
jgi:hypothetical protein